MLRAGSPPDGEAALPDGYGTRMSAPQPPAPDPQAPDPQAPDPQAPAVVDDRRADPPPPAAAELAGRDAPATEAERETMETVRSISRLEESN